MTMSNAAGGHVSVEDKAMDVIERLRTELQEAITAEQLGRAEYERMVSDSRVREDRLKRSLRALEGGGSPKQTTATAKPKHHDTWQPSEENVQRVLQGFLAYYAEQRGPVSMTQVRMWMKDHGEGVSSETIKKVAEILRERELIRPAGKIRGGGTVWAPMPRDDEAIVRAVSDAA